MGNGERCSLVSSFGFLFMAFVMRAISAANYVPTDYILLNCGGSGQPSDLDGRKWTSDILFALLGGKSFTSRADIKNSFFPRVPYITARIFQSEFTYSFPVESGRKFVRLYFYPANYAEFKASDARFSVVSGSYTLLKNFSAAQTVEALKTDYVVKEYSIHVPSGTLNVTFIPDTPNSYAFVNGIEVLSHPDIYNTADETTILVGQGTPFIIDNTTALENIYRLTMGGQAISRPDDTGLYRLWLNDAPYIYGAGFGVTEVADDSNITITYPSGMPSYVAPVDVYSIGRSMDSDAGVNLNFNMTWIFSVDSGFYYLFRLHFCEIWGKITKVNQRVFNIFIGNQTAESGMDLIAWATEGGSPVYKDYVVLVPNGLAPQQDIWLAMAPDTSSKSQYYNSILNGLEIFKVSDFHGNLAGPNPVP